jgi:uncharacterized damage-inducible protein DinB
MKMSIAQSILPEFDHEMANTRKVLERVPEDRVSWKPHERSTSLGDLAVHLANLPVWTGIALKRAEVDVKVPESMPARRTFTTRAAMLESFDRNVADARKAIEAAGDAVMMEPWTLKNGGEVVLSLPKAAVLRSFVMNHSVHHRGQMTVYLRMNDVPLPAIYGNSADEQG